MYGEKRDQLFDFDFSTAKSTIHIYSGMPNSYGLILIVNYYQHFCETGLLEKSKKCERKEYVFFCSFLKMETEKHFILEC